MSAIFVVRNSTSGKPQEIMDPPIKCLFVIGYNKFINIIYSKYNFVNDRPKEFPPDPGVKCKQSNQRLRDGPVRHQLVGTFHA